MRISEFLEVDTKDGRNFIVCTQCGKEISKINSNYKLSCIIREDPLGKAGPLLSDVSQFIDETPIFRQFFCPGCGILLDTEIARKKDDPLWDVKITIDGKVD